MKKYFMKKYLLTVLSVVSSITLMGQQNPFTIDNLTYTIIQGTNNVKVKKKQNENLNNIHVVIPDSVTNGSNTYYTVTEIENQAFQHSSDMLGVTIPNTVTTIGEYAFENAGNNKTEFVVNMGSGVVTIKTNAFHNCQKLKYIRIPSTCTSIEARAFEDCQSLVEMHIPNPDCTLEAYAFAKCRNLQAITLPYNLIEIPEGLLMNCDNHLREIVIPESVTSIGSQAFGQVHNAHIVFLGCGDGNNEITVKSDAFANNHNDFVEFFCTDVKTDEGNDDPRSVRLKIVPANQWSNTPPPYELFGNNLEGFQVPCGMNAHYAMSIYDNASQTSNINAEDLCLAITRKSGDFCDPATWRGYDTWDKKTTYETETDKEAWLEANWPNFVPRNPIQPFIIDYEITQMGRTPHVVTLKHRRDIYPFNSVNNGIMIIDGTSGGQLIERDSLTFNANITLNVNYSIANHDGDIYLIKDYPVKDSTDITSLLNGTATTEGDYKKERGYIRDTKTRYLLTITQSNNTVIEEDKDYYHTENSKIYYYGTAATVDANGYTIDGLQPYVENTTTPGFYIDGSYIKHVFSYNNQTVTVTIERNSGNVTLRGSDYTYGHVRMHQNLAGEIHVKVPAEANKWNFVGAPFNVYDLYAVKLHPSDNADASAVRFDYGANDWESVLSYGEDTIRPGEGFLAWPFYAGGITFSTKREYGDNVVGGPGSQEVYTDFVLNNDTVYVEKNIANNTNKWMALANPYPAKLCVNAFVSDNTDSLSYDPYPDPTQSNTIIQGQGVYILNVNSASSSWEFKPKTDSENGYDLGVGQGFFVNVAYSGSNRIMFTKSQIHEYLEPQCEHGVNHSAKSSSQREFIRLSMIADNVASELLFAHNEDAQQYYDIYDANKLFAMERMTEPYFVTDGIKLVKKK